MKNLKVNLLAIILVMFASCTHDDDVKLEENSAVALKNQSTNVQMPYVDSNGILFFNDQAHIDQYYEFLGDMVDSVGDFLGSAAEKVGDVVGSVAEKVDIKDLASLAALASGNPQLAASFQTMGGGTGNPYLDTGLQIYSGFQPGKGFSPFPTFGMPQEQGTSDALLNLLAQNYTKKKTGTNDDEEKKPVTTRLLEALLSPEGIAGLTGAYLGYKDQKRVNEALQKRYEDYRRAEEAKRKH